MDLGYGLNILSSYAIEILLTASFCTYSNFSLDLLFPVQPYFEGFFLQIQLDCDAFNEIKLNFLTVSFNCLSSF